MKLFKLFMVLITVILLNACQGRISFNKETAAKHDKMLREYYSESQENNGSEIIRHYILNQLRVSDAVIEEIVFERDHEYLSRGEGINIVCRLHPQMSRRIMLIGLYSPWALYESEDFGNEVARMSFSLAFMLETARMVLDGAPGQFGIDLVFLDSYFSEKSELHPAFRHFVDNYQRTKPEAALYLRLTRSEQMIIPIDSYSYQKAPHVVYQVWKQAQYLGLKGFEQRLKEIPQLRDENILYEDFNMIKLQNRLQGEEIPEIEHLKESFQILGSLLTEIIYDRD